MSEQDITKEEGFDLPAPDPNAAKASVPRVHIGGSTCESCEG